MIDIPCPERATILGLMSGTSCDGLDLAILEFGPGPRSWRLVRGAERAFPETLSAALKAASDSNTQDLGRLSFDFMRWCAEAINEFVDGDVVDLVVSHGQTIFHEPPRATWQLGDGNVLAALIGRPVLWNLRSADVAVGGQGAPLVPVPDRLFFAPSEGSRWILNLGGIANLTRLTADGEGDWGGDVGPANCWLDAFVSARTGGALRADRDGAVSGAGRVDTALLAALEAAIAPTLGASLARETFSLQWLERLLPDGLSTEDGAATLVALTARCVARQVRLRDHQADALYVAGGGANNPSMMAALATEVSPMPLRDATVLGLPAGLREAACFAALGWLWLRREAGASPRVTGAARGMRLGSLALP